MKVKLLCKFLIRASAFAVFYYVTCAVEKSQPLVPGLGSLSYFVTSSRPAIEPGTGNADTSYARVLLVKKYTSRIERYLRAPRIRGFSQVTVATRLAAVCP